MHMSSWCEGSGEKRTFFWPVLTEPVGHLCHRSAWNPCLWVWELWEHRLVHRASLSQWGTEQNLHTIRENRFRLCSWITVPAGDTQSSTLYKTGLCWQPCSAPAHQWTRPQSSGLSWKTGRNISLLYRNAVSQARPFLTDCSSLRQEQLNKWKMSHMNLSAPPLIFSRAETGNYSTVD